MSVFIDRIRQVNQRLNAVVIELFDEAIAQAKLADILLDQGKRKGPLHGVPITIKESFFMKGTATTAGLDKYKNRVSIEIVYVFRACFDLASDRLTKKTGGSCNS